MCVCLYVCLCLCETERDERERERERERGERRKLEGGRGWEPVSRRVQFTLSWEPILWWGHQPSWEPGSGSTFQQNSFGIRLPTRELWGHIQIRYLVTRESSCGSTPTRTESGSQALLPTMFTGLSSALATVWKWLTVQDGWVDDKTWPLHTVEYDSALKKEGNWQEIAVDEP
jgi:hypothetical protein